MNGKACILISTVTLLAGLGLGTAAANGTYDDWPAEAAGVDAQGVGVQDVTTLGARPLWGLGFFPAELRLTSSPYWAYDSPVSIIPPELRLTQPGYASPVTIIPEALRLTPYVSPHLGVRTGGTVGFGQGAYASYGSYAPFFAYGPTGSTLGTQGLMGTTLGWLGVYGSGLGYMGVPGTGLGWMGVPGTGIGWMGFPI